MVSNSVGFVYSKSASRCAPPGPRPFLPLSLILLVPSGVAPLTNLTPPSESTCRMAERARSGGWRKSENEKIEAARALWQYLEIGGAG